MKEIKTTRTIEVVSGYEAFDGKLFKSKEECEKYENSVYGVLAKELKKIMVGGDEFAECDIFEHFGYGSEEFGMAILDIKTEKELNVVNRYYEYVCKGTNNLIGSEYIGKRVLVSTGNDYDRYVNPCPHTEEELIEQFKKDIQKFFRPETTDNKANN